jgi:hypothetical protein
MLLRSRNYFSLTASALSLAWVDTKVAIAHNKVMMIDGQRVITGLNFTTAALAQRVEPIGARGSSLGGAIEDELGAEAGRFYAVCRRRCRQGQLKLGANGGAEQDVTQGRVVMCATDRPESPATGHIADIMPSTRLTQSRPR